MADENEAVRSFTGEKEDGGTVVAGGGAGWMRIGGGVRDDAAPNSGGGGGCHGRWKERRKLGLGFWEMKMMTWQPSIGQLVSARIVATWLSLVG